MLKKIIPILIATLALNLIAYAEEIPVKVAPASIITTADKTLQEGDSVNFVTTNDIYVNSKLYIKKGETVTGIITSLVNNDFTCQSASIYAENFKVKTIEGKTAKLKGIVFKEGRNHSYFTQYLGNGFQLIRGGETKILPDKDSYTLYLNVEGNKPTKKGVINDL